MVVAQNAPIVTPMEFALAALREDPTLDYAALRERATAAGLLLPPILYGRARKALDLPVRQPNAAHVRPARPTQPAATNGSAHQHHNGRSPVAEVRHREATRPTVEPAAANAPDDASADIVKPRRAHSAVFELVVQQLRQNPTAPYGTIRDALAAQGHQIAPIVYGRAKALLGLVPVKPRGSKNREPKAAPPRQLRQVESVAADNFARRLQESRDLEQIVQIVKDLDAERRRLRQVLEQVVDTIDNALG